MSSQKLLQYGGAAVAAVAVAFVAFLLGTSRSDGTTGRRAAAVVQPSLPNGSPAPAPQWAPRASARP